jgi:uncharacterized Zn-finger protein
MAEYAIPYFKNDAGVAKIRVKAKEFMCVGASPPLDHPHIFIDMGHDSEAICPYCSTAFVYDMTLRASCHPESWAFVPNVETA